MRPGLKPFGIGHPDYVAALNPDRAFWALVRRDRLAELGEGGRLLEAFRRRSGDFEAEMASLRGGLSPSAVYLNPTDRCNLDCGYCYLPGLLRRRGGHMPAGRLLQALGILERFFRGTLKGARRPQVIFHGAEPLLNREAVFEGIRRFGAAFDFGIQTNGVLLDGEAADFLTRRSVSIGLSLDAALPSVAGRTRRTWGGRGVFGPVVAALRRLEGYGRWNVICTVTRHNVRHLAGMVDFLHAEGVPTCMLNVVRCTRPEARRIKPSDREAARHVLEALDRTRALYRRSGRKLVVANFANILLAILAPQGRRLMCDISPCGGGRCFFAVAASGDVFPCSEFIGLPRFRGGNLFDDPLERILESAAFAAVTGRRVEDLPGCRRCPIRHFCGAPCPAEAHGEPALRRRGAFCGFYKAQARYAFRLIADGQEGDFLWDGWDRGMASSFPSTGRSSSRRFRASPTVSGSPRIGTPS